MLLSIGTTAPNFSLRDQYEKIHSLADYAGHWLIIYFYPKDDTPGCTTEACNFRDSFSRFEKNDIAVIGVSVDPITSHQKFTKKFALPFTLLSDTEKTMVEDYGVWGEKSMYGKKYEGILRTTFLINPKGDITAVYENVNPEVHVEQILRGLSL